MKQLFPFIGIFNVQPEEVEKLIELGEVSGQLEKGFERALSMLLRTTFARDVSASSENPPLLVTTYSYSTLRLIAWIWHHEAGALARLFDDNGPLHLEFELGKGSQAHVKCHLTTLPPKLPSCCLEVRWKKDEHEKGIVTKLMQVCMSSGSVAGSPLSRHTGCIIQFESPLAATEALARSKQIVSAGSSHSVRQVAFNEHTLVPFRFFSQTSDNDDIFNSDNVS